jgi:hypothetical protein
MAIAVVLVAFFIVPTEALAQSHVVSPADLQKQWSRHRRYGNTAWNQYSICSLRRPRKGPEVGEWTPGR